MKSRLKFFKSETATLLRMFKKVTLLCVLVAWFLGPGNGIAGTSARFSGDEVKEFFIQQGLNVDHLWNDQMDRLSARDRNDLLAREDRPTETPFPPQTQKILSDGAQKIQQRILEVLVYKNPYLKPNGTPSSNRLSEFLGENLLSVESLTLLALRLGSYFDPRSIHTRTIHQDPYILDSPSLPVKLTWDTTGYTVAVEPTLDQSGPAFLEFESGSGARTQMPEVPELREEPEDHPVSQRGYLKKILAWMAIVLLSEHLPADTVPHPMLPDVAPGCYYDDLVASRSWRCVDSLSIYVCGHSFVELRRATRKQNQILRGMYPTRTSERGLIDVLPGKNHTDNFFRIGTTTLFWSLDAVVVDESRKYTPEELERCPHVEFPLTRTQSNEVLRFIQKLESEKQRYTALGNNCADFSQLVFSATGYPGHFLDKVGTYPPIRAYTHSTRWLPLNWGALSSFIRQRGFFETLRKVLYDRDVVRRQKYGLPELETR